MCFIRQFLRKTLPIHLASLLVIACRINPFLLEVMQYFLISHTIGPTDLVHLSPAAHFKTFQIFLIYYPKCPSFSTIQCYAPNVTLTRFFLKFKFSLLVKRVFLLNAAFATEILYLISRLYLASFVITLPKWLKYSLFSNCFWSYIVTRN